MTDDRIESTLGSISANLSALNDRMDRDREDRLRYEKATKDHQIYISDKVQALEKNQILLIEGRKASNDRLTKVETKVGVFDKLRNQAVGAVLVASMVGSLALIAVSESIKKGVGWIFSFATGS